MAADYVYPKVAAYLTIKGAAEAIGFYGRAFGAVCVERYDHEGRVGHAMLDIDGGQIMLSDEYPEYLDVVATLAPETLGGTTAAVNLSVDDVDAGYDRAVAAGATSLRAPTDEFFGRQARLRDPYGHVWGLVARKKGD